jgi:CRISPR-associated protein Cas7/Csp1
MKIKFEVNEIEGKQLEKLNKIKLLGVHCLFEFKNHNVNSDMQGSPKNNGVNGFISGQKIRYCTLQSMNDVTNNEFIFGRSDKKNKFITKDLSSLFGGYMQTEKSTLSLTKRATLLCPPPLTINKQETFISEGVRFSVEDTKHMPFNKVFSRNDIFNVSRFLDLREFGSRKVVSIEDGFCKTKNLRFFSNKENKEYIKIFLESLKMLDGLGQQGNNTVDNTPKEITIIFNPIYETKDWYSLNEKERENYRNEILNNNGFIVEGNNKTDFSVYEAIKVSINKLNELSFVYEDYEEMKEEEFFNKKLEVKIKEKKNKKEVEVGE